MKKKSIRRGRTGSADVLRSESEFDGSSGGLEYEPLHVDADMITSLLARPLYGSFLIETMVCIGETVFLFMFLLFFFFSSL